MGPRVIGDASVLILFARAGQLGLLHRVVGDIEIPAPVRDEVFQKGPDATDVRAVQAAIRDGWIRSVDVPGNAIGDLTVRFPNLGLGEAACLALAPTDRSIVLLDDASARRAARLLGVRPVGCLGILAKAYRDRLLGDKTEVSKVLRELLQAGLWVSGDVVERFWAGLGGR